MLHVSSRWTPVHRLDLPEQNCLECMRCTDVQQSCTILKDLDRVHSHLFICELWECVSEAERDRVLQRDRYLVLWVSSSFDSWLFAREMQNASVFSIISVFCLLLLDAGLNLSEDHSWWQKWFAIATGCFHSLGAVMKSSFQSLEKDW